MVGRVDDVFRDKEKEEDLSENELLALLSKTEREKKIIPTRQSTVLKNSVTSGTHHRPFFIIWHHGKFTTTFVSLPAVQES